MMAITAIFRFKKIRGLTSAYATANDAIIVTKDIAAEKQTRTVRVGSEIISPPGSHMLALHL
jgi:hypothetical protein